MGRDRFEDKDQEWSITFGGRSGCFKEIAAGGSPRKKM
jgi:hypothetical protein